MAKFQWKAQDYAQVIWVGETRARSKSEVEMRLRQRLLTPLAVERDWGSPWAIAGRLAFGFLMAVLCIVMFLSLVTLLVIAASSW